MYSEQDYQDILRQLKERRIAIGIPAALGFAGIVVSLALRIQWLTALMTVLAGVVCIFGHYMVLAPVAAYRDHLDNVLHGRVRKMTGTFQEMEELAVLRDGVMYYPMMLNVGNPKDPEDDRLLYYDANLPRPDWQTGEQLTLTIHDKAIGKWERAE